MAHPVLLLDSWHWNCERLPPLAWLVDSQLASPVRISGNGPWKITTYDDLVWRYPGYGLLHGISRSSEAALKEAVVLPWFQWWLPLVSPAT